MNDRLRKPFRSQELASFLPGRLVVVPGTWRDYLELEPFHYIAKRPATHAAIRSIRYFARGMRIAGGASEARLVAVGVLSYPVPASRPRERYLHRAGFSRKENLRFANAHIRTISRVIVHPQFRSIGLSTVLVRALCDACPVRYVEAIAMMARAHPFFERAGMTRIPNAHPNEPAYFILDRGALHQSIAA